jgi:hypothetical protein
MREKMRRLFLSFALVISTIVVGTPLNHSEILKSKFPYGLLGDDYGILTTDDLAINACRFKAQPFPPEAWVTPFEYWQCFDSKSISFDCDSSGVSDEHEGAEGLVVVKASIGITHYEYIERRPWPIRECRNFIKELRVLLKGSPHACISGSYLSDETDKAGRKTSNWLFERLKTRKGCEGRDCEFTEKMRREHCPKATNG